MGTPYVEVYVPDIPPSVAELNAERCVVGSAIACQVVIERPEFAREHVMLAPRADGCFVALARGAPTPIIYNGAPLERGIVPWGSELFVGPVRLVLQDGSRARAGDGGSDKKQLNPIVIVAAGVVVLAALGTMMLQPPTAELPQTTERVPKVFDDNYATVACPQAGEQAREAGNVAARNALAKAERYPFSSQDGIEAVRQFVVAASCHRVAGDVATADAEQTNASALRNRLEDEVTNHKFRLDRAMDTNRPGDALFEARMLRFLLLHRRDERGEPHRYLTYLNTLERSLAIQADQLAAAAAE